MSLAARHVAGIAVLVTLLGCPFESGNSDPSPADRPARVLFLGNSLTYTNEMPEMVRALAAADGISLTVSSVTAGGAALEDLWNDGAALEAIDDGNWDVVVMQQGPSSQPDSRVHLREWTRRFDERIRAAGGRSALYMVWPSQARFGDFQGVSDSYRLAAEDVDGVLAPAGEAWLAAWRRDSDLPLYGSDLFHPSAMGSYLAALVIYGSVVGGDVSRAPANLDWGSNNHLSLSQSQVATLRAAAEEAIAEFTGD